MLPAGVTVNYTNATDLTLASPGVTIDIPNGATLMFPTLFPANVRIAAGQTVHIESGGAFRGGGGVFGNNGAPPAPCKSITGPPFAPGSFLYCQDGILVQNLLFGLLGYAAGPASSALSANGDTMQQQITDPAFNMFALLDISEGTEIPHGAIAPIVGQAVGAVFYAANNIIDETQWIPTIAVYRNAALATDAVVTLTGIDGAMYSWSLLPPSNWNVGDQITVAIAAFNNTADQYYLHEWSGVLQAPATAAQAAAILAKTNTLGSGTVAVNSFVSSSGDITIVRNADHKAADGTAWSFADPGSWPSLAGSTITLSLRQIGDDADPAPLILTGELSGSLTGGLGGVTDQLVTFEATHTQTAALVPSQTTDDYCFDIVAVLASGNRCPLLPEGTATVVCNVTGTGLPAGQPTPVAINSGSQW